MSILCCHIPDFLLQLTCPTQQDWAAKSLALIGPDDRVCALSPPARQSGVQLHLLARQAQMRCPDLLFRPLNLQACQDGQAAFLAALAQWDLPIEASLWGLAYVDLHAIAADPEHVQPLAADLGRRLRRALGESLQPALGWDSSKFTARAAAIFTVPGRMRLVGQSQESHFLSPLSIALLPLPPPALQQLHWLGIRTLGQFSALPAAAIWQRFGPAGKLAQSWARGCDNRPVHNTLSSVPHPILIDLDPPITLVDPALHAIMAGLNPYLQALFDRLEGCYRLRLELHFLDRSTHLLNLTFVEPVSRLTHLQSMLADRLRACNWPAELERVEATILDVAELPTPQITLFPELLETSSSLESLVRKLAHRYTALFFRGALLEEHHPVAERRTQLQALA